MDYDALIIGGGPAGLSAALVLGRARRRVLVFDEGEPSNAPAHLIGGLLGQHGTAPHELREAGRRQLAELPTVEVRDLPASVVEVEPDWVEVDGIRAEALLLATGMRYRIPDLPGIDGLWGDTVFHCPFCHGWEVREQPLAVLAGGEHGLALAKLLRAWSDDVVLLTDGEHPGADALEALAAARVAVDERAVAGLRSADGRLAAVEFADGGELARAGLLVRAPLEPRSPLYNDLALERGDQNTVVTDAWGRTNVARVFAAGDIAEPSPSVAVAIAAGSRAGAGIVQRLLVAGWT